MKVHCYFLHLTGKNKVNVIFTFHPFGIEYPWYVKSVMASLKVPWVGGTNLRTSQATFQEYLIFDKSSQFNNSFDALDFVISICSVTTQMIYS